MLCGESRQAPWSLVSSRSLALTSTTHLDKVVKCRGGNVARALELETRELLPVALDRIGVADANRVGVTPGVAGRAPLAEQVPAPIEFDLDVAQTPLIGLERVVVHAVRLLAGPKLVLLGDETLDPRGDVFVTHTAILVPVVVDDLDVVAVGIEHERGV